MIIRLFVLIAWLLLPYQNACADITESNALDYLEPGSNLAESILQIANKGYTFEQAVSFVLNQSVENDSEVLTDNVKNVVASNLAMAELFYIELLQTNKLSDAIKIVFESHPDKIEALLELSLTLYPERYQEIFEGTFIPGILTKDELINAFTNSGVKTDLVSDEKDIQLNFILAPILPLGAGIGSGGTGSGDVTVSMN